MILRLAIDLCDAGGYNNTIRAPAILGTQANESPPAPPAMAVLLKPDTTYPQNQNDGFDAVKDV